MSLSSGVGDDQTDGTFDNEMSAAVGEVECCGMCACHFSI